MTDPYDPFGLVASVLERKYRVDRVTAEGGFGVVYRGYHLGLDVPVAIKVLKAEVGGAHGDQDFAARFLQEGKTLARLKHPNIVSVLDTGLTHSDTDGPSLPWIVLEWLDGETLAQDLAHREGSGGRSLEAALALMVPLIEAVREAHDAGVAHRDLKPANIMLMRSSRGAVPKVLDFGIAKLMRPAEAPGSGVTQTHSSVHAFSTAYASPEQLSGARTGPWTDVHALALILTELLTDTPPFRFNDRTEIHAAIFNPQRPSPSRFGVDVGPVEGVLTRALAVKPAERYADANEFLEALLAAAGRDVTGVQRLAFADTARPLDSLAAQLAVSQPSERPADVTLPDSVRQETVTVSPADNAATPQLPPGPLGALGDVRDAADAAPEHAVAGSDARAAARVRGLRLQLALIALVLVLVMAAGVQWVKSFASPTAIELPISAGSASALGESPQTSSASPEPPALTASQAIPTTPAEAASRPPAVAPPQAAPSNSPSKLGSPRPGAPPPASALVPAPLVSSQQAPGSYALD